MTTHLRVVPAPPRHRTPTQRAWGLIWHSSHRVRLTAAAVERVADRVCRHAVTREGWTP